jgi:uncharacterized protein involved in exopolysaccharide biosynthesis
VNSNQPAGAEQADGIDIVAIVRLIWRYRYLVAGVSLLFAIIAAAMALTATEIFRAEIVVTEVHDNDLSGGGGGLGGQIGGLASLAGLNLGGSEDASAQGVLASRHLIEEFVKKDGLVPLLTIKPGKRATLWFAVKRFQDTVVTIHNDERKGLTTVSMDWTDAATAAKWANGFLALANEIIRAHVFDDATRNVAYLNKQIAQTNSVEIQKALYNLIESETKKLMLANAREEYAFRIVDPAVTPEVRHSPKRTLWVISGTALGFILGSAFAYGYDSFRRRKLLQ